MKKSFKGLINVAFQQEIAEKMGPQAILNKDYFLKDGICREMVLTALTGAGKTVMEYLYTQLILLRDPNAVIIHISIGKGDLHLQTMRKIKEYSGGLTRCYSNREIPSLRTVKPHDHYFLNWEGLNKRDKKTGKVISTLALDYHESKMTFPMLCRLLKEKGLNPYLIIDEDHESAKTIKSQEIIQQINPVVKICQSATSKGEPSTQADKFEVSREAVIASELITLGFIMQRGLKKEEKLTRERIFELAFDTQLWLLDLAKKEGVKHNPLLAIQIANGDLGEEQKRAILKFFKEKGISEKAGNLAIFLSEEKSEDIALKEIDNLDSPIKVLIFKQAIATGWDCPRAKIWVKLRDIKSTTFNIQTGGRFLRTINQKYFKTKDLNYSYMFTDEESFQYDEEVYQYEPGTYNKELKIVLDPDVADKFSDYSLMSEYSSREGNYRDLKEIHSKVFNHWVEQNKLVAGDFEGNRKKLQDKGYDQDTTVSRKVVGQGVLNVEGFLDKESVISENNSYCLSENEVTLSLKSKFKLDVVGNFSLERSWGKALSSFARLSEYLYKEEPVFNFLKMLNHIPNWNVFLKDVFPFLEDYKKEMEQKESSNTVKTAVLKLAPERLYNQFNNKTKMVSKSAYCIIDKDSGKKINYVAFNSNDPETETNFYDEFNRISSDLPDDLFLVRNGKNTINDLRISYIDPVLKIEKGYHPDLIFPQVISSGRYQTGIFDIKHWDDIKNLNPSHKIFAKHQAQMDYIANYSNESHSLYGGLIVKMVGASGMISFRVFEGELNLKALNKGDFSSGIDFETYIKNKCIKKIQKVA